MGRGEEVVVGGGGGGEITQISVSQKNMNLDFWCKISKYMYSINFKFLLEAKLDIEGGKMETGEMGELQNYLPGYESLQQFL